MANKSKMTTCKVCGAEIAKSAKVCPACGAKNKKPIFKRPWFIILVVLVIVGALIVLGSGGKAAGNQAVKEAGEMGAKDFIKTCQTYDYKELVRNPDEYADKPICLDVRIEQYVSDDLIRAYSGSVSDTPDAWYDEEFVLEDVRESAEALVEGDILRVYGIYLGTKSVDRAIGGTDSVPTIAVIQTGKPKYKKEISKLKKSIQFEKTSTEYGWSTYEAVVENTTEGTFGSFGVTVLLKDGSGTTVDTTYASVEKWKPGEKAKFSFETDAEFSEIVVESCDYYSN